MKKIKQNNGDEEYCKGADREQLVREHVTKRFLKRDWEGLEAALITYDASLDPELVQREYNKILHPNAEFINRKKLLESITEIESHTGIKLNSDHSKSLYHYALEGPDSFSDSEFLKMAKRVTSIPPQEDKVQAKYNDLITGNSWHLISNNGYPAIFNEIGDIIKITCVAMSEEIFKKGFSKILERELRDGKFIDTLKKYFNVVKKDLNYISDKRWLNEHIEKYLIGGSGVYLNEISIIESFKKLGWKQNKKVLTSLIENMMREGFIDNYERINEIMEEYNIPLTRRMSAITNVRVAYHLKEGLYHPSDIVKIYSFMKRWAKPFTSKQIDTIKVRYHKSCDKDTAEYYGDLINTLNNNLKK